MPTGEMIRGRLFTPEKPVTFNQLWTPEEQKRLEELLEIYPDEPVAAHRWAKIATALGNRTPRQVASRTQKHFIKLAKLGLPIPGKMPNLEYYVKSGKHKANKKNKKTNSKATKTENAAASEGSQAIEKPKVQRKRSKITASSSSSGASEEVAPQENQPGSGYASEEGAAYDESPYDDEDDDDYFDHRHNNNNNTNNTMSSSSGLELDEEDGIFGYNLGFSLSSSSLSSLAGEDSDGFSVCLSSSGNSNSNNNNNNSSSGNVVRGIGRSSSAALPHNNSSSNSSPLGKRARARTPQPNASATAITPAATTATTSTTTSTTTTAIASAPLRHPKPQRLFPSTTAIPALPATTTTTSSSTSSSSSQGGASQPSSPLTTPAASPAPFDAAHPALATATAVLPHAITYHHHTVTYVPTFPLAGAAYHHHPHPHHHAHHLPTITAVTAIPVIEHGLLLNDLPPMPSNFFSFTDPFFTDHSSGAQVVNVDDYLRFD